jgi:hypothetical protein
LTKLWKEAQMSNLDELWKEAQISSLDELWRGTQMSSLDEFKRRNKQFETFDVHSLTRDVSHYRWKHNTGVSLCRCQRKPFPPLECFYQSWNSRTRFLATNCESLWNQSTDWEERSCQLSMSLAYPWDEFHRLSPHSYIE